MHKPCLRSEPQAPDHSTISRFRKDNKSYLKSLFLEVLRLCAGAGLVKLGKVSLDGTKIKADASLAANCRLKHLEQEVAKMLPENENLSHLVQVSIESKGWVRESLCNRLYRSFCSSRRLPQDVDGYFI